MQLIFLSFLTWNSDAAHQWCPGEWPLCPDHHCCLCWLGEFGFPCDTWPPERALWLLQGHQGRSCIVPKQRNKELERQCWTQPLRLFQSLCFVMNECRACERHLNYSWPLPRQTKILCVTAQSESEGCMQSQARVQVLCPFYILRF